MIKIAPSILSGDHGSLSSEASRIERWGADWIHVDIMDGIFAPNLTFGPGAVKAIRKAAKIPLDCHLMLSEPEKFVDRFFEAGGDIATVHAEVLTPRSLDLIEGIAEKFGKKIGIAFKPATPLDSIDLVGRKISLVIVMTVNPGFSGQKFMPEVVPKVAQASEMFGKRGVEVEVDGGVDKTNAHILSERGATVLVAGNSVLGQSNPENAFWELKKSIGDGIDKQQGGTI